MNVWFGFPSLTVASIWFRQLCRLWKPLKRVLASHPLFSSAGQYKLSQASVYPTDGYLLDTQRWVFTPKDSTHFLSPPNFFLVWPPFWRLSFCTNSLFIPPYQFERSMFVMVFVYRCWKVLGYCWKGNGLIRSCWVICWSILKRKEIHLWIDFPSGC